VTAALIIVLVGLGGLAAGILVGRYYVPDDRHLKRTAKASRAYMRALNHLIARDHDTVIDELRKVVEENVEDVEPYFALGALFRSRGEHERSIRVHQALAVREGGSRKLRLRARYELGLDFRAAGMPRRATRAMEDCLVDDPKHEGALRALCGLYEEQGRYAEAAAVWQRLAKLRGGDRNRREHHLLVAAAQRAIEAADLDSAKRFLRDARNISETPHFFAAAAELAAARENPRAASARIQQALVAAPELARFLVPGLVEAERQLAEASAPRAHAKELAKQLDAELDGDAVPALAPPGSPDAPLALPPGTGEPGRAVPAPKDLDRAAAERAVAALHEVVAQLKAPSGHLQLAIAELESVYDPGKALGDYRALADQFPDLLPARVAAARLAIADGGHEVVAAELKALAGAGGTLSWAFDGSWRCAQCGRRGAAFFWRCVQCRRWGSSRLDVGREAQQPPPRTSARERRELPRVPVGQTLLGAAATEALPEPTLEHGLSVDELTRASARPSVFGRMRGWFGSKQR